MLYLVGGASRAGKTSLAQAVLKVRRVPWFPLDALRMGLAQGMPGLGFSPANDDLEEADRLWPLLDRMLNNLAFHEVDYLVEGVTLRPGHADAAARVLPGRVRAVFLGYPGTTPDAKAALVRAHAGGASDWLSQKDDEFVRTFVANGIERSAHLEEECRRLGLPFVNTGADFGAALQRAEGELLGARLRGD